VALGVAKAKATRCVDVAPIGPGDALLLEGSPHVSKPATSRFSRCGASEDPELARQKASAVLSRPTSGARELDANPFCVPVLLTVRRQVLFNWFPFARPQRCEQLRDLGDQAGRVRNATQAGEICLRPSSPIRLLVGKDVR